MATLRLQVHNRGSSFGRSSNSITYHNCAVGNSSLSHHRWTPRAENEWKGGEGVMTLARQRNFPKLQWLMYHLRYKVLRLIQRKIIETQKLYLLRLHPSYRLWSRCDLNLTSRSVFMKDNPIVSEEKCFISSYQQSKFKTVSPHFLEW